MAGSLLLGLLIGVHPPGGVRVVFGVGFLGAFTTFSTLMGQMYHAFSSDRLAHGLMLSLSSVTLGVFALWVGVAVGRGMALASRAGAEPMNPAGPNEGRSSSATDRRRARAVYSAFALYPSTNGMLHERSSGSGPRTRLLWEGEWPGLNTPSSARSPPFGVAPVLAFQRCSA